MVSKLNKNGISDVNSIFEPTNRSIVKADSRDLQITRTRNITKAERHGSDIDLDLEGIGSPHDPIEMIVTRKMSLNPEDDSEFAQICSDNRGIVKHNSDISAMVTYKTRANSNHDPSLHSTAASSTHEETLSSSAASQGNYDNLSML